MDCSPGHPFSGTTKAEYAIMHIAAFLEGSLWQKITSFERINPETKIRSFVFLIQCSKVGPASILLVLPLNTGNGNIWKIFESFV
jgi:hypothetical protein